MGLLSGLVNSISYSSPAYKGTKFLDCKTRLESDNPALKSPSTRTLPEHIPETVQNRGGSDLKPTCRKLAAVQKPQILWEKEPLPALCCMTTPPLIDWVLGRSQSISFSGALLRANVLHRCRHPGPAKTHQSVEAPLPS
jgi:hypothetical protein